MLVRKKCQKQFRSKNLMKKLMLEKFLEKNNLKVNKIFGSKIFWIKKNCGSKKIWIGLTQGGAYMTSPPPPKNVGLKLCWVIVSLVYRWGRMQNFRPLGPLFLVEVEFVGGWGGWCGWCGVVWTAIIMSNPTRLGLGWVVVRLGFWQYSQTRFETVSNLSENIFSNFES